MDKICKNCRYFKLVTFKTGFCWEDQDSPVYPEIDDTCDFFQQLTGPESGADKKDLSNIRTDVDE